jgi:lysophospholipase L1-like esterase
MRSSTVASVRTVFIGDSHLARLRRELWGFDGDVLNAAEGGATSRDLSRQADTAGVGGSDCVVVSVGTNDAAPWKQVPVAEFEQAVSRLMTSYSPRGWVFVAPPGVVEERLTRARDRTNGVIDAYRLAAIALCEDVGGHVVRTDLLLETLGATAFAEDGLHLNGTGYRVLVPAIQSACDGDDVHAHQA